MRADHVLISRNAVADMVEGKAFYDRRSLGLGNYFWDCLISDIGSLIVYAGVHISHFGFFRMLSRRFPYAIYYELNDKTALVVAVLPMRRRPNAIKAKVAARRRKPSV